MAQVETNGITTYYEEYGSGPPIVAIHGAMADHQGWAEILQPLTENYRVLLYDLRGHGRTEQTVHKPYTVETYADDLAAFIDAIELDRPAILGHSLGGMVGYTFADRHPEKLSALITVGSPTPQSFTKFEWVNRHVLNRVFLLLTGNERVMKGAEWLYTQLSDDDGKPDEDALQRLQDGHDCETPLPSGDERRERAGVPMPLPSERGKIGKGLQEYYESSPSWRFPVIPFLVMYGENEHFVENHATFLERELEHCQSREIPDATHNAQADNPEFIRAQIREFLSSG